MSTATSLPGVIRDKLLAMDRQQRELAIVSGVGLFLCLASAAVGLCLLADAYGNLSPTWRGGFLIGLSVVLLGGIWLFVIRPLWRRRSWAELAAAVERDHPELKERLTTLIELRSDAEFGRVSSPLMRDMLAKQTVKAVSNVDFTQALPAGRSLQRGALGLAALAVLLVPFLLPGGRYSLAWSRLLAPWGNYAWGSRLGFEVLDGDRVVVRGSDVTLQAKLLGAQPSPETPLAASLEAVDERGVKHRREVMTWNADQEAYEITLPRVEQSFRYRVTSRRAESREYHITAANRPQIAAWHIDVQPPAYTGLPAQSLDALGEELTVPEHSRLKLRWQFAEPVAIGSISWPESIVEPTPVADDDKSPQQKTRNNEQDLRFSDDRRSATAELSADVGGSFTVQLTSDLGLDSEEPARGLAIIPDQPPEIEVPREEIVASVRPEDVLSIPMFAQDDYGLTAVEVHWETSAGVTGSRALPPEELIDRKIEHTWQLDLSDWRLTSGQAVTCRLRAVDNRPVPNPQETWSEPIVVSVSNDAKSAEALELAAAQQSLENELKRLQDAVAEQQDAVDQEHRETAREAVKGKERPEENREDLQQLRERQEALRDQLERLRAELQQRPLMEKAAGERLPEIERQLVAAEKSLNQAAEASEARNQIEQLSKSLDELAKAESELDKLAQESKALAALEQELAELSRLSRQADKLADEAERLEREAKPQAPAKSAKNGGDAQTAKSSDGNRADDNAQDVPNQNPNAPPTEDELERLRKETEQLTAKLDDLLRRRPELLDAARQDELERLERLAQAAERLAEPQAQLAEAMSREALHSQQPESRAADESKSNNQNGQNVGQPASDQPASADQPAQADQPAGRQQAASQSENQPASANRPSNSPESTPSDPAAESRTAEANPQTPATPNAETQQNGEAASALEQQIAEAVRQQQQLAREAAELQQALQPNAANSSESATSKPPAGESPKSNAANSQSPQTQSPESNTGQKSGDQSASESKSSPPEEQPLEQFAKLSQAAAKSAQAGDLEQAAKQSQSACQACQNAAKSGNSPSNGKSGSSSPDGKSGSPSAQKAGQLAERQEALANEFQRLAQSSEARQQAQLRTQQQLSQAAQSLAKALEQSSQELSQRPLNEQKAGQCASGACQSAKSAGNAMSAASQALAGGMPSKAAQAAHSAREQLEQAASQARQAAADSPPTSPQASQIPGQTAGQVARAANQLQQAQSNLAQAETPPAANSSPPGQSPSQGQAPSPGESGGKESSPSPGGKPSSQNGTPSNQPGGQPGSGSTPNSNPGSGQPKAAVASQEESQPSPLEQSADNLRQAARALAAACQSCRNPGGGKPGANGKSNSPGRPGSASRNGDPIANQPDEPGHAAQSPEGFVAFGNGSADPISELDPLDATAKPAAGMRNWGRLPKHLESEIVQGQAKKSHPEYSRQIKRYFEKIAQPEEKR